MCVNNPKSQSQISQGQKSSNDSSFWYFHYCDIGKVYGYKTTVAIWHQRQLWREHVCCACRFPPQLGTSQSVSSAELRRFAPAFGWAASLLFRGGLGSCSRQRELPSLHEAFRTERVPPPPSASTPIPAPSPWGAACAPKTSATTSHTTSPWRAAVSPSATATWTQPS